MRLYLRRHSVFVEYLELDPATGAHWFLSKPGGLEFGRGNGLFELLDGTLVAIYLFRGKVLLRTGFKVFEITDDFLISVSGPEKARTMRVSAGGDDVFHVTYPVDFSRFRLPFDFSACVEPEHYDFGMYLSNFSKSPDRKKTVAEVWRHTVPGDTDD